MEKDTEAILRRTLSDIGSELKQNEGSPIVLNTVYLTDAEVEGECIDWLLQYLRQKKFPTSLSYALAREVVDEISKEDISAYHEEWTPIDGEEDRESSENGCIVIKAEKLAVMAFQKLAQVCDRWKEQVPTCQHEKPNIDIFMCAIKNSRRKMEDRHAIQPEINRLFNLKGQPVQSFFAVFDGHNGTEAANYVATHLHCNVVRHPAFKDDVTTALREGFRATDDAFCARARMCGDKSGTTAVVTVLQPTKLHVAWCGDSQVALVRREQVVSCMKQHKPDDPMERDRIEKEGGAVVWLGTWRVNGMLAVSRAIGDVGQKPYVTAEPGLQTIELDGTEDYMVLACDGLWDVLEVEDLAKLVREYLIETNGDKHCIAERLVKYARNQGSSDNITVVVVFFNHPS